MPSRAARAIALRRASLFGRAPVIHDLRIAFTIWGFLDPDPPADLRRRCGGSCSRASPTSPTTTPRARALADIVPEATLRMTPAQVAAAYPASGAPCSA